MKARLFGPNNIYANPVPSVWGFHCHQHLIVPDKDTWSFIEWEYPVALSRQ